MSVPDRFIVYYRNKIVIDTGYRGADSYNYGNANREAFTAALEGKTDPKSGGVYPLSTGLSEIDEDGYPKITTPGAGTASFFKKFSESMAEVRVYAPMSGTAWDGVKLGCPNDAEEPVGGSTYSIVHSTSVPVILSGDAIVTCIGIATGEDGIDGEDGKSAYIIAVEYGFEGTEEEWLELQNKSFVLPQAFQMLVAKDISKGVVQNYDLILKCREDIEIESIVVSCDSGGLANCSVKIDNTAIVFVSDTFNVTTSLVELSASAYNIALAGSRITFFTSTTYIGEPTTIYIQLNFCKANL